MNDGKIGVLTTPVAVVATPLAFLAMPVALLATLAVMAVLGGGCQTFTGRTVGRWVDDQTITATVKDRLAPIRSGSVVHVKVGTYEGVVYVSGVVDSEDTKQRMEEAARGVDNVEQVVRNVTIKRGGDLASPGTAGSTVAPGAHPLLSRLHGFARIVGDPVARPQGPWLAYDRTGRLVATIYTVSMRDLAQSGLEDVRSAGREIDHVAIYPIVTHPDVPEPEYHVVLWHVSRAEAARLR